LARIEPSGDAPLPSAGATTVAAVAAEGLACQRGGQVVVSDLSFEVRAGSALVLRGPNGSGKTTLLRTIAGFIPVAAGTLRIIALPLFPPGERAGVRGNSPISDALGDGYFHYIGHANAIKPRLSVIENVRFWQRYYSGTEDIDAVEAALDAFALLHLAGYSAGHLSQGQARRLGLARLLAAWRPVWLLDEPSVSLDAASVKQLETATARHLASGGIAIVSTHMDLALPEAAVLELGSALPPQ
jgi:heme exporter protein A